MGKGGKIYLPINLRKRKAKLVMQLEALMEWPYCRHPCCIVAWRFDLHRDPQFFPGEQVEFTPRSRRGPSLP